MGVGGKQAFKNGSKLFRVIFISILFRLKKRGVMSSLSKEELRKARLARYAPIASSSSSQPSSMSHNIDAMAPQVTTNNPSIAPTPGSHVDAPSSSFGAQLVREKADTKLLQRLNKLLVGPSATPEDMLRWHSQGFNFSHSPSWGLKQGQGGPCGILASVQAEMLRELFFSGDISRVNGNLLPEFSKTRVSEVLVVSLVRILSRAKSGEKYIFIEMQPNTNLANVDETHSISIVKLSTSAQALQYIEENEAILAGSSGVLIYLMSLLLTRGLDQVLEDMDDVDNTLIGHFGHCTQDLLNLLLSGKASSNVFDGMKPLGGESGFNLKGVFKKSSIGYLTHLEALRYCQVGEFFKIPEYPIWVLGSSSHFSVLFSLDRTINEQCEEEKILSEVQRVFKSFDPDECGFIQADELREILTALNLQVVHDDTALARIKAHLRIDGDIILWGTFWINISRLMTGSSVDDLFVLPDTLDLASAPSESYSRPRSDSEVARALQAELDGTMSQPVANENSSHVSSMDFPSILGPSTSEPATDEGAGWIVSGNERNGYNRPRSDSDVARELQQKLDSEDAVNTDSLPPLTLTSSHPQPIDTEAVKQRVDVHRSDSIADESALPHTMYHFNGLEGINRPAKLTTFYLYKRSILSSIGQSVSLTRDVNSAGGINSNPIEEILATRWPGCRVNWVDSTVPSVD
jgi:hypothetical protein